MTRPRSFIWQRNIFGPPTPQIVFDDPRTGSLDIKPIFEIKIDLSEHLSLDQLAARYPAPQTAREVSEHLAEMSKSTEGGAT